jgi:hypothetical protein
VTTKGQAVQAGAKKTPADNPKGNARGDQPSAKAARAVDVAGGALRGARPAELPSLELAREPRTEPKAEVHSAEQTASALRQAAQVGLGRVVALD